MVKHIPDTPFGVYIWKDKDGKIVADSEYRMLSISAKFGDEKRVAQLREAARYYGIEGGKPEFLPDQRKVTDEEYEEQVMRMKWGLVPDPLEYGSAKDDEKNAGN